MEEKFWWTDAVAEELQHVLSKFDCKSDKPGDTSVVELSIDTGSNAPIQQQPYSVPMALRERVREELGKLEASGIIERSSSKWSSPMHGAASKKTRWQHQNLWGV